MKKIIKKIIAGSLAVVCAVTTGVAAIATNGFGLFGNTAQEQTAHNNQLSFGNFFENGITLTASAAESTAVTLTHGNDYNATYADNKTRASIQPYGIAIPSGVTLTAKTGYQFGFYSVSDISAPTSATMLGGGWMDTYTTSSSGTYGITIKKVDDSEFDFSTDSIYVADYVDSTDSSIFGVSGSGDSSTTPSTPSTDDSVKGVIPYNYTMQAGYYDDSTGELVQSVGYFCTEWINASVVQDVDHTIKVTIQSGYVWTMIAEKTDGTYQVKIADYAESFWISVSEFPSSVSHVAFYVRKADQDSGSTLTLEEAQNALTLSVGYRHSYNLTATVNEEATDKSVTWSVAWADGSTTDVDAYIQLEVTSADGLTVAVRNIQAFEKQIVVKVTSVSNPDVYAQCTLDYIKRLSGIDTSFGTNGTTIALGSATQYTSTPQYSKGTLDGTLNYTMKFTFTDEFITALKASTDYTTACNVEGSTISVNNSAITIDPAQTSVEFTVSSIFGSYTQSVCGVHLNNAIHNTANEFEAAGTTIGTVQITGTYTHSSGYTYNYADTLDIFAIDSTAQTSAVTGISLDKSSIIF